MWKLGLVCSQSKLRASLRNRAALLIQSARKPEAGALAQGHRAGKLVMSRPKALSCSDGRLGDCLSPRGLTGGCLANRNLTYTLTLINVPRGTCYPYISVLLLPMLLIPQALHPSSVSFSGPARATLKARALPRLDLNGNVRRVPRAVGAHSPSSARCSVPSNHGSRVSKPGFDLKNGLS